MARIVHPSALGDWRWEGNIQRVIAGSLRDDGWTVKEADTTTQERGVDIRAELGDRLLLVEVKGYPSTTYVSGPKAGKPKPTSPSLQAHHWFGHALLAAAQMRERNSNAEIAIGLPYDEHYQELASGIRDTLWELGIGVIFVRQGAPFEWWMLAGKPAGAAPFVADSRYTASVVAFGEDKPQTTGTFTWRDGRFRSTGDIGVFTDEAFYVRRPVSAEFRLRRIDGEEYVGASAWALHGTSSWIELQDASGRTLSREELFEAGRSLGFDV